MHLAADHVLTTVIKTDVEKQITSKNIEIKRDTNNCLILTNAVVCIDNQYTPIIASHGLSTVPIPSGSKNMEINII